VSECYEDTPYTVTEAILDSFNCQYYAHGDDPVYGEDGVELCGYFAERGRFE